MALWDMIREIRENAGLDKKQFGEKIGCSSTHVIAIERPYEVSKRTASDELLIKIAKVFSKNEDERLEMETLLLLERARLINPDVISTRLKEEKGLMPGAMPPEFIERFRSAYKKLDERKRKSFLSAIELTEGDIAGVLKGDLYFSRSKTIDIAQRLQEPIDEYLTLGNFVTYEILKLAKHTKLVEIMHEMAQMNPKEIDEMLGHISYWVNFMTNKRKNPEDDT